ncbi:MAG: ribosome maturation factor RimP [Desulfonatronovibrio sp.]
MKSQEARARIIELARTNCRIMGVELWGVEYFPGPGGKKGIVRIYIDADQGVSIDQCAELSRNISVVLDVEDIVPGAYALEVSSPGLDRIFFSPSQMKNFISQKIKLSLNQPRGKRKNFSGILQSVDGQKIHVESDSHEKWEFDWEEIEKAKLDG